MNARRVLAVLECHPGDAAVLNRAVAEAEEAGGYLTLVAVAPGMKTPTPALPQRRSTTFHTASA